MPDTEILTSLRSWLTAQEADMLGLLEQVININSHTPNKPGTDRVADIFAQEMSALGLHVTRHPQTEVGDHLTGQTAACKTRKQILMVGHMDTVFPVDSPFQTMEHTGETITGPGIIDMKGGLVVALFALKALAHMGMLQNIPACLVFNSDEETGSLHSTQMIRDLCQNASHGLVFECAGMQGQVVTGRKGKANYRLDVTGEAGHVGVAGTAKPSAVLELAHQTIKAEALNAPQNQISVNVGLVQGGTGPNIVAKQAMGMLDCRYPTVEAGQQLYKALEASAAAPTLHKTTVALHRVSSRPPMEQVPMHLDLARVAESIARQLGIPFGTESRGGVSDANTIAAMGVPVIDGLGPMGELDHSPREYMVPGSLLDRAVLTAGLLLKLGQ